MAALLGGHKQNVVNWLHYAKKNKGGFCCWPSNLQTVVCCRRPIEERVVHALGKAWHVEVSNFTAIYFTFCHNH